MRSHKRKHQVEEEVEEVDKKEEEEKVQGRR